MKLESLYRHFLLTKATHLPVVGKDEELLGFLPKDRVHRELSDLGREREELSEIPGEFLESQLHENLLYYFKESARIPVINKEGEKIADWDKPRFLAAFSKLDSKNRTTPAIPIQETKKPVHQPIHWFMEMILSHFPDGLLATDVNGVTVFYNEGFELNVLPKPPFSDSLQKAEVYLKQIGQELLAEYLKTHDLALKRDSTKELLSTYLEESGLFVRIITLKQEKKVVGFLYHFSTQGTSNSLTLQNVSLEKILEQTEAFYISQSLERNKNNISHAAQELGLPRTTLQNRIRYLKLDAKKSEKKPEKIPRKRQTKPVKPSPKPKRPKPKAKSKTAPRAKKSKKRR